MPELSFAVQKAEAVTFAAAPLLAFRLQVRQTPPNRTPIHTVVLQCQIRLEPTRRRYSSHEQERLTDLFDSPARWSRTLRPMLWTHASVVVPPFVDSITVDLPVPCTFDFNLAATKYFYALEGDEAPLTLLFSGTIFYEGPDGTHKVAQIPWETEAMFNFPARVWKEMIEHYYPNTSWLSLRRDVFDLLYQYKTRHHLPTWEQTVEHLLAWSNDAKEGVAITLDASEQHESGNR